MASVQALSPPQKNLLAGYSENIYNVYNNISFHTCFHSISFNEYISILFLVLNSMKTVIKYAKLLKQNFGTRQVT